MAAARTVNTTRSPAQPPCTAAEARFLAHHAEHQVGVGRAQVFSQPSCGPRAEQSAGGDGRHGAALLIAGGLRELPGVPPSEKRSAM